MELSIKNTANLPEIEFSERHIYKVLDYVFFISRDNSEGIEVGEEAGEVYLLNVLTNEIDRFTLWLEESEEGEVPNFYICLPTSDDDSEDIHDVYNLDDLNLKYSAHKVFEGNIDQVISVSIDTNGDVIYFLNLEDHLCIPKAYYKPMNAKYGYIAYKFSVSSSYKTEDGILGYLYLSRVSHFYHNIKTPIKRDGNGDLYTEIIFCDSNDVSECEAYHQAAKVLLKEFQLDSLINTYLNE